VRATFRRVFTEHPSSVGETYLRHAYHSAQFGVAMLRGAVAAFVHAVVPALCTTTGSRIIGRLHHRMILNRTRLRPTTSDRNVDEPFLAENI
jgi:hypothetical protein